MLAKVKQRNPNSGIPFELGMRRVTNLTLLERVKHLYGNNYNATPSHEMFRAEGTDYSNLSLPFAFHMFQIAAKNGELEKLSTDLNTVSAFFQIAPRDLKHEINAKLNESYIDSADFYRFNDSEAFQVLPISKWDKFMKFECDWIHEYLTIAGEMICEDPATVYDWRNYDDMLESVSDLTDYYFNITRITFHDQTTKLSPEQEAQVRGSVCSTLNLPDKNLIISYNTPDSPDAPGGYNGTITQGGFTTATFSYGVDGGFGPVFDSKMHEIRSKGLQA